MIKVYTIHLGLYKSKSSLFNKDHRDEIGLDDLDYKKPKIYPYFNHLYNMRMNGINVLDQLVSSHERNSRKDNWKMASYETSFKLIEVVCYQMYTSACKARNETPNYTHWEFKQAIGIELVKRRSERVEVATGMTSEVDINLHPIVVMQHRGHCKFEIDNPNPTTVRKYPKVKCERRTKKGCMQCSYNGKNGLYLCGEHQLQHQQIENQ